MPSIKCHEPRRSPGADRRASGNLSLGHLELGPSGARARQRGAVIVLVLVTVLLAAFLLTAFIRRSGTELLADARSANMKSLRADAYSALETTLAVLADFRAVDGALRSPAEGWEDPLTDTGFTPAAGREVAVSFEDESAKISLPNAGETEIQTMLEFAGVERNQAERLSHVLHAWAHDAPKDAAVDMDVPDYGAATPAYQPAHRALRSWGELAAVELNEHVFFDEAGRPTPVFDAFRQEVSLLSFRRVNLNAARAGVLTALGLGSSEVQSLQDYRARPKPKGETGVFRSITEANTIMGASVTGDHYGTNIEALRINVEVRQGQVVYRLSAVVSAGANASAPQRRNEAPKPGGVETAPPPERKALNYPFTVLEIKENSEPTAPEASPTS